MGETLGRADHVGAGGVERQGGLARAEDDVSAHAGGEVQDHVGAGVADALHHLAVERQGARRAAGLGIADVDMGDGGAGVRSLDAGLGDLLRRDGHVGAAPRRVARARDRAGDEDGRVHARISGASSGKITRSRCFGSTPPDAPPSGMRRGG